MMVWIKCLWLPCVLFAFAASEPAGAAVETARVVAADSEGGVWEVAFDAGRPAGVQLDGTVTLLRPGEPIIHPLSGEVLGEPQEPVGRARIFAVEEGRARAVMVKVYTVPRSGDRVEFERGPVMSKAELEKARPQTVVSKKRASPLEVEHGPVMDSVLHRVEALEAENRRASAAVRDNVDMRRVWDEIEVMKSYLLALDERLVQTEHRQGDHGNRINTIMAGGIEPVETEELTIRYSSDTRIKLRTAGKTLYIDVEADSVRLSPAPVRESSAPLDEESGEADSWIDGLLDDGEETPALPGEEVAEGDEQGDAERGTWYQSPWTAAIMAAVTLVGGSLYLVRRRKEYDELLAELDEDDDYGDDDYDDEDEDDDDEDEDDDDDDDDDRRAR